jgi:uncharacterized membrane protein
MSWFIWILISVVTTAVANIFQRVVMREKDIDPYATTVIFQFATALLTGIFAFGSGFVLPPIQQYFWNFTLGGVLWGLMSYTSFLAYQSLGSSEIAILSSFGTVVTILSAMLFLGETFTAQKVIGTVLILSSVILVSFRKNKLSLSRGVWYALLSTVIAGFAITNDAFILKTYDAISYTPVMLLLPGILLLLFRPAAVKSFGRLKNLKYSKNMFFLAIFYSAQAVAYYVALHIGADASQVAPISKASIILTVLLALIFLKEKDNLFLKLLSTLLVTVGVLLVR